MEYDDYEARRRPSQRTRTSEHRRANAPESREAYGQRRSASAGGAGARHATYARPSSGARQPRPAYASSQPGPRSARQGASRGSASRSAARRTAPARGRQPQRRRKRTPLGLIVGSVAAVALLCVGGFFLVRFLMSFNVTVNGEVARVHRGDTVQVLLDKGYAEPTPGDLLAIDGSLLTAGEGEVCTATINGQPATVDSELSKNAEVSITDGGDRTEDVTETEEPVPAERREGDTSFGAYWNGSIHLLSDGVDGTKLVRTGTVSGKTEEEITKQPIDAGYRIYTARPVDRAIALTFDDGPWPDSTGEILDILEQYGAKATFFTIGNQIADYADQVRRAHDMGCQICTHTWDHAAGSGQGVDLGYMTAEEQVSEVTRGYEAIANAIGEDPKHIMRAPGGNFNGDTITNLWDYVDAEIGWDVDTEDWSRPGVDAIVQAILSVQPGQVILMHDGGGDRSQTVEALRQALPTLVEQGYSFVTVDELLSYGIPA